MEKFTQLCETLVKETGVDPRNMYCSATGMVVGTLTQTACIALYSSLSFSPDDEQMCDELLIRTLNSARPSPAWNMFEPKTLDRLRQSNPTLLLAYLLNRLYAPLVKNDRGESFARVTHREIHDRINLYAWCSESHIDFEYRDKLMLVLLELDSRWNLMRMAMPFNVPAELKPATNEAFKSVTEKLQDWLTGLVEREIERNRLLAEEERSFVRGNKLTRVAFMQEFIRQTPKSEGFKVAVAKKAKRVEDLDFLNDLESSLTHIPANGKPIAAMSQPREAVKPFTPRQKFAGVAVATNVAPKRFGGLK